MSFYLDRYLLNRVVSIINNKGGVGKTTLVAHAGALAAARLQQSAQRVLLIDLDEQGNLGEDLGFTGDGRSDFGLGLSRAVDAGDPPHIIRDVRPGLDVIPGGHEIVRLASWLQSRTASLLPRSDDELRTDPTINALALMLAKVAPEYGLVLIDCPPHNQMLQELALVASTYVLIPTKTDLSSRLGMGKIAMLFDHARRANPDLRLLGAVLFGVTPAAKNIRREASDWIGASLGDPALVFKATVRHVEGPAFHVRERGQLAHELELGAIAGITATMAKSFVAVAGDFTAVTSEMLSRLFALEAQATAEQEIEQV